MASENETVAKVIDDFAYLITLGNIGPNVATDIKNRIEAAHKREVAELRECLKEAIGCADEFQKFFETHPYLCKYTRDLTKRSRKALEGANE